MTCDLCQTTPLHAASRCAFDEKGVFDPDNYLCGTIQSLRELAEEEDYISIHPEVEQRVAVIPVPDYPLCSDSEPQYDFVILGWYKSRGRTEQAFMMSNKGEDCTNLTLGLAEIILNEARR